MENASPVVPPPDQSTPQLAVKPAPVMDVVSPVPPTKPASLPSKPAPAKSAAPSVPAAKKPPKQGVATAIFACVVIVLGLAALAVYAYLKSR